MTLEARLETYGLFLHGVASLTTEEIETYSFPDHFGSIALVGNTGSSYWSNFSQSVEFRDGDPDPLDRWSQRVADEIAAEFPVQAVFPFDGPPYFPFQRWAQRAEGLSASPLGILIHPDRGLWHSYRFALLGDFDPTRPDNPSPCLDCTSKPCLNSCPVDAISTEGYEVNTCSDYLVNNPDADCHELGCRARYACPIATDYRYLAEQGRFHLQAFLADRRWH